MMSRSKRFKLSPDADGALRPSAYQLRQLWYYDNLCAHKYMGVPLRNCSTEELPDEPGTSCISSAMMTHIENQIEDLWQKLRSIFEVFYSEEESCLGYRLRVKQELPISITMRPTDNIPVGWKAVYQANCPSEHLYRRSDMLENLQYLGGPVSYCNFSMVQNLTVRHIFHGSSKHLVVGESKVLPAGCELLWNYNKKSPPESYNEGWFKTECCFIMATLPKGVSNSKNTLEVYRELCVLCGQPYKAKRRNWTKRKCQRKVHFLNSHADFLGTDWDGCGVYDTSMYKIDYKRALIEAERLNQLLHRLASDSWKAVPACVIMKQQELDTLNEELVMKIFKKRCDLFRKCGSVALRGGSAPYLVEHLHPIQPSRWDLIFPKGEQPARRYALSKTDMAEMKTSINESVQQDVMLVLGISDPSDCDSDSDSE